MTVQELMEVLETLDPNIEVVLSSDPEGNKYSTAESVKTEGYFSKKWSEFFMEDDIQDLERDGDDDIVEDGIPCVCIYPTF